MARLSVEVSDEYLRDVKAEAAQRGVTLSEFVRTGVTAQMSRVPSELDAFSPAAGSDRASVNAFIDAYCAANGMPSPEGPVSLDALAGLVTFDEVLDQEGVTREELAAMPDDEPCTHHEVRKLPYGVFCANETCGVKVR